MDLKQAASLLGVNKETVRSYIDEGLLTRAENRANLRADSLPTGYDISEDELDAFISCLETDDPGRHPPVSVRRELLIETGWKCAVCTGDAPLEFHHIIEWAKLKHHDPVHMLAVCANCHAKITRYGMPDQASQKEIKKRLQASRKAALKAEARVSAECDTSDTIGNVEASETVIDVPCPTSIRELDKSEADVKRMRDIFSEEVSFDEPSEEDLAWVEKRLFRQTSDSEIDHEELVVLRSLRAIIEIQKLVRPEARWVSWTYRSRLLQVASEVLAEFDEDPLLAKERADIGLAGLQGKRLLKFEDVDEWRPGMQSGSGWVTKVTLSRIGEKALQKYDE